MAGEITAKCKNCEKNVNVSDFILDPHYKMMVCSRCSKARSAQEYATKKEVVKPEIKEVKPAGWDMEDEYLEKAHRAKTKSEDVVEVNRLEGNRVKYTCPKCNYGFSYDMVRNSPSRCPYCCSDVFKVIVNG